MSHGFSDIRRVHASLQGRAAALFRALDARDAARVQRELSGFLGEVTTHLRRDVALGYRLLRHHPSESVRRISERLIAEQSYFQPAFEEFAARWREAEADALLDSRFRDELETLVSNLLKRIRVEDRLMSMIASVA
jgi:hypothetical protein